MCIYAVQSGELMDTSTLHDDASIPSKSASNVVLPPVPSDDDIHAAAEQVCDMFVSELL